MVKQVILTDSDRSSDYMIIKTNKLTYKVINPSSLVDKFLPLDVLVKDKAKG